MDDLVKRLRASAYWMSGSSEGHEGDNNAPLEAAARIEAQAAMLRECVEALERSIEQIKIDTELLYAEYANGAWTPPAMTKARTTLTRAKEMLK